MSDPFTHSPRRLAERIANLEGEIATLRQLVADAEGRAARAERAAREAWSFARIIMRAPGRLQTRAATDAC